MGLNQPDAVVSLPEAEVMALLEARNKVTLLEAEATRLKNVVKQEKDELVMLASQKASLIEENITLKKEGEELAESKRVAELAVKDAVEKRDKEFTEIAQQHVELDARKKESEESDRTLGLRENKIIREGLELHDREAKVQIRETAVAEKERKIKTLVESL